jgi:hypothetical protein
MTSSEDSTKYSTAYPEQSALIDEISRLRAENAELRALRADFAHRNAELWERAEQDRANAERYRWLKANAVREKKLGDKYIEFHCDFESWNDIDAAIDKAIKEAS